MKLCLILICLVLFGYGEKSCKSKAQASKNTNAAHSNERSESNSDNPAIGYEVLMSGCSEDDKCVVIAYCDPALFNKTDMEKLVDKFSSDFKRKKIVNVNLFDKKDLAQSYAKGTRNLGDLQNERRGWYFLSEDKEFLLFYPDPNLQGKPVSIKPKRKGD